MLSDITLVPGRCQAPPVRILWLLVLLAILGFENRLGAAVASDTTITATTCANTPYLFQGALLTTPGIYTDTLTASNGADSVVTLDLSVLATYDTVLNVTLCPGESYVFEGDTLTETGAYTAVLTASNGCDSTVTLKLLVLDPVKTEIDQGICEGAQYLFQGDTLTAAGNYFAVLTTVNGCDSTVALNLSVVSFFDIQLEAAICPGDTYTFGDTTLQAAGVYVDSLLANGGCDSIVTLTLTILPAPVTALNAAICDGAEYVFFDDTLTTGGLYARILPNAAVNGCDSIVTLDLEVVTEFTTQLEVTICAGSSITFGDTILSDAGIYTDTLQAVNGGCDSILVLTLSVLPTADTAFAQSICQGDTLHYGGLALSESGVYEFVLQAENGCDSTVTLTLEVLPAPSFEFFAVVCAGESVEFQGDTLTTSGVYTYNYAAANGCDSTLTLHLDVLPLLTTTLEATICAGDSFVYETDTLSATGNYSYVFLAENGCDSTVTVALTVQAPADSSLSAAICAGQTYVFGSDTLNAAGVYSAVFQNTNGCDSTVTLTLDVLPLSDTTLQASICANGEYLFNGDTLTAAGAYTAVLTGLNGCDSTVTLVLEVLPGQSSGFDTTICANTPFVYNGTALSATGAYDFTFTGLNGCDSIVTVNLTVLPVAATTIDAAICPGAVYEYNGDSLSVAGEYPYTYVSANGCDSVVTIALTILPTAQLQLDVTLCFGQTYLFDGDTLSTDGSYTAVYTGANGCDSTVNLTLTFVPAYATALEATICDGESYPFGNELLTQSGVYTDSLQSAGGCDSILTLTLTVLPLAESIGTATICAGDTLVFNGQEITETGFYIATLTGANGCDSLAGILVDVLPTVQTNLTASICAGQTYPFNGQVLDASGDYTAVLTGTNGCDSTVTLTLTVLPAASSALSATICDGGEYQLGDQVFDETGVYDVTLAGAAANGCDSVVTLSLTELAPIPTTQIATTICSGDTLDFYGIGLSQPGIYTAHLATAAGCDSTIQLVLTVLQPVNSMVIAEICAGQAYDFNGQSISEAGTYTAVLQAANGCDSIVMLVLTVLEVDLEVFQVDETLIAQSNGTIEWIDCDNNTVVGTGMTFTATETGNYAAVATLPATGCTDTSACAFIEIVGVHQPAARWAWNLQPNPAGSFTAAVLKTALPVDVQLEIYDAAGRRLHQETVAAGTNRIDLDLNKLPDGLFTVRLIGAEGTSVRRLVKTN